MVRQKAVARGERIAIVQWTARMGAVTAEALADRDQGSVASARARLVAAQREGLLARRRPLAGEGALYTVTKAGLAASGLRGLEPCRVSPSNAEHLKACAAVAVALERCYPDHGVIGERELRLAERELGAPLASARLPGVASGGSRLHRPDLVLRRSGRDPGLPIAVEVELTVKAPRRLAGICQAWARSRDVAGVLYLASPPAERALLRAVRAVRGAERIVVVPLDALVDHGRGSSAAPPRTVAIDP